MTLLRAWKLPLKWTIVLAVAALVLIGGTVTAISVSNANAQAKAAAQAQKDDAWNKQLEAQAKKKAASDERASTLSSAKEAVDSADSKLKEAASYGDAASLAALTAARSTLEAALAADYDPDTLTAATTAVGQAIATVGTLDQAQARAYLAAATQAGRSFATGVDPTSMAKAYCAHLVQYYPDPASALPVLVNGGSTAGYDGAAIQVYCPQYAPVAEQARWSFISGNFTVGAEPSPLGTIGAKTIAEGTYTTPPNASDCYWERHDGQGNIIDNDFVTAAPSGVIVTVHAGEGFTAQGCGLWTKQ